jgi:hypothetical protein
MSIEAGRDLDLMGSANVRARAEKEGKTEEDGVNDVESD